MDRPGPVSPLREIAGHRRLIDLLARAGYGTTKFKTNNPAAANFDGSHDSWNYGVGAEYKFDDKNGLRADWTKSEYTKSDLSSNTMSVGYVRRF